MTIGPMLVSMIVATQAAPTASPHSRWYGFVASTFAHHPPSDVYYRNIIAPVHGNAWDVSGGGGVFLIASVGIEGELVYGGIVSTPQYTFFDAQHRDVLLNALARFRPGGRSRLQFLAGGGFAWSRMSADPPQSRNPTISWRTGTLTFGADVVALDARHVGVAPSFRVRWVNRDLYFGDGLGRFTYQLGATVFVR